MLGSFLASKMMKNVRKMKVFQDGHMCQPMLALLGHLLAMLAPSGLQLGQLGLILALSWVMLTPFWAMLAHLGAMLAPSWLPLGHLGSILALSWAM